LARDGVYLRAPSLRQVIVLGPANRADIAIRCDVLGEHALSSQADHGWASGRAHRDKAFSTSASRWSGTLLWLSVSGSPVQMQLPISLPAWPDYLAKLFSATSGGQGARRRSDTGSAPPPPPVLREPPAGCAGCRHSIELTGLAINGKQFDRRGFQPPGVVVNGGVYRLNMTLNTVQEWTLRSGQ
jgi:hypothetical protein